MFCLRFLLRRTFSTDYALRLLMLVGLEIDRLVTIEEVADRFGISKNHLMKVAYQARTPFVRSSSTTTVWSPNGLPQRVRSQRTRRV